jgi:hypothetical protein
MGVILEQLKKLGAFATGREPIYNGSRYVSFSNSFFVDLYNKGFIEDIEW